MDHPILPLPESRRARTFFAGRYLSRPMFLEAGALAELERDLSLVWSALASVPDRLYDGDLKAYARAVGMSGFPAECITRSQGPSRRPLTRMARADLYRDADGFRVLEWNLGSPTGGMECVDLCRALVAIPELAAFLATEGLAYPDTVEAMLATLRAETGYPAGTGPAVALIGNPGSFSEMRPLLQEQAAQWAERGLSSPVVGHLGELTRSGGRLRLRGEPVDVVYRLFGLDEALAFGEELLEPLLAAAEAGEVVIFTPLDAELCGSKGALALLSEPAGQVGLTAEQRAACDRLVPWTRLVRGGQTALADGSRVELLPYLLDHQAELVLKPSLSHGGHGVLVGAERTVTPAIWRERVAQAVREECYVVQRLVRPVPEPFPTETPGRLAAWTAAWGVFLMRHGYAGSFIRAVPADAGDTVVNFTQGARIGCAFHVEA